MDPLINFNEENEPPNAKQISDRRFLSFSDDDEQSDMPKSSSSTIITTSDNNNIIPNLNYSHNNYYNSTEFNTSSPSPTTVSTANDSGGDGGGLPEFIGKGGGSGIFRVPLRKALHPGRPPSLEVRPHPLRESQTGCFLRTITTNPFQLCSGSEDGSLLVWKFSDIYRGIHDTAPYGYTQSAAVGSGVLCLLGDDATGVVWSGHKDGKIRCWKMNDSNSNSNCFKEVLSWIAHRGPVLSMVLTSYGDLWSGSEAGALRIWPWEAIHKSFSLTKQQRHIASLSLERSFIDPKTQLSLAGFCNALNSDIRYLLSDHSGANVWSVSYLSFALWDAHTRELLKIFNIDGQIDKMDPLSGQDITFEDDIKMKTVAGLKKEKIRSSFGFFQRSRNAIMGAAGAVRRVTTKGSFGDDYRRTEALVITMDGMIWTGCANGLLVQWDGNGNRLQDFHYHSYAVQSFSTFGIRIWVGYASGTIQVLDLEGNLLGEWLAHSSPVIKMAVGAGYVFTLANHGGIRGWSVMSPGPIDNILRSELAENKFLYTNIENLKILAGTWNVAQGKASRDSLISWLGCVAGDVGIVVVGLQEVEMSAGALAMSAAKETVGLEGSSLGQWWLEMTGKILDEGSSFVRVGSRQLAGLLISVWVRNNLKAHVGDVDAAAVPCGFGHAIGNKGAVGLKIRVYNRTMTFVNCHFAAHSEAVNRRNADFDHVYRTMTFGRPSLFFNAAPADSSSAVQLLRSTNVVGANCAEGMPELSEADMVIFLGDFNYRLDGISYDEARDFISQRSYEWLREKDQLRAEMEAGDVFQGMREAIIRFPPTYKFDKHQPGLAGYDSGEKKRVPAWCDRILYRDSRSARVSECSLDCPVVSLISQYDACMDVTDSDHKPVRCTFSVDIARVDESVRRQEFGDIIKSNDEIRCILEEQCKIPETVVSTNNIILQHQDTAILRIANKCEKRDALFEIICEDQFTIDEDGQASDHHARGSFGFPRWLKVTPATGVIKPDNTAEVSVHIDDFPTREEFLDGLCRNSWSEDSRDEEAILVIKVHGANNTVDWKDHRVRVRHSGSARTGRVDPKSNSPGQVQGNLLPRSDHQLLSSSYDVVDHLRKLHGP
ncbi:type II inositol polyphosphate 5-phosphatase 15-like [Mercurialis annua]|uniref:type II inositol polyphosphate 5-phosphatase 15-like n=1 Tax=Mercurialis annua TaxID=3986 RepID=UPI00215EA576|nr:type II inositol polyphosphate 5-phosphatase 15-like [Mercurialis annua]